MAQCNCYHCGLPVPEGSDFHVTIQGEARDMCCLGCQAVAQAIVENGLEDYYRTRDALPESPREAVPEVLEGLRLYDHAEFQKSFVKELGDHEREASLLLEGITCAACIWLNERHLAQLPGVTAVDINYANRRARVRWDEECIHLSDILTGVAAIGFRAYPYDPARSEQLAKKERRTALWRVWVAGFSSMTLSGAWNKLRDDPILKFLITSLSFYGMSTFEGPMMSVKSVNALSHYTDWTVGHVHSGALGWVAMVSIGSIYYMIPRLFGQKEMYSTKLVTAHFWIATIGVVLYIASLWIAGVMQGLMWRAVNPDGTLTYSFVEAVKASYPFWTIRLVGGIMFLSGMVLMFFNVLKTIAGNKAVDAPVLAPAAHHA